jgi:hypothetical protein
MAAVYWHLLIAERIVASLNSANSGIPGRRCIVDHPAYFAAGSLGPDIHYFPGGDKRIANLAHNQRPVDLGLNLISCAANETEEAYARGWMLHIVADIVTHELVNRYVAERLHTSRTARVNYSADPLGHHRIEWGIDVHLLGNPALFSQLSCLPDVLSTTAQAAATITEAYRKTYGVAVPVSAWSAAAASMARAVLLFRRAWLLTGRIPYPNRLGQAARTLLYAAIVYPAVRIACLRSPQSGAGILIPVLPGSGQHREIMDYTRKACNEYMTHLEDRFASLKNQRLEG